MRRRDKLVPTLKNRLRTIDSVTNSSTNKFDLKTGLWSHDFGQLLAVPFAHRTDCKIRLLLTGSGERIKIADTEDMGLAKP